MDKIDVSKMGFDYNDGIQKTTEHRGGVKVWNKVRPKKAATSIGSSDVASTVKDAPYLGHNLTVAGYKVPPKGAKMITPNEKGYTNA